jgi:hypothetical protein
VLVSLLRLYGPLAAAGGPMFSTVDLRGAPAPPLAGMSGGTELDIDLLITRRRPAARYRASDPARIVPATSSLILSGPNTVLRVLLPSSFRVTVECVKTS